MGALYDRDFNFAENVHSDQLVWHIHGGLVAGQGNVSTSCFSRLKLNTESDTWEFNG